MIKIKITNAQEIFEKETSWFIAKLAPHFIDLQARVEEEIANQIKKSLEERNIQAIVTVMKNE